MRVVRTRTYRTASRSGRRSMFTQDKSISVAEASGFLYPLAAATYLFSPFGRTHRSSVVNEAAGPTAPIRTVSVGRTADGKTVT